MTANCRLVFTKGGIQQSRGQNFVIFCLPPPLGGQFLYQACLIPCRWTRTDIFDALRPLSVPRRY